MNVAEYIVKYLEEEEKIEHAYVIVGGAALWICKALSQAKKLKFTFTNHEQPAVMSAEGYGRVSGKPGVAFVTNGPALTNTVTALAQAYVDSGSLVLFTGDSNHNHLRYERDNNMRQYGTQDVRSEQIVKPVTKKAYVLDDPAKTAEVLTEAFWLAKNGRPGPVCIDVPITIQGAECPCEFPPKPYKAKIKTVSDEKVDEILDKLMNAKRPLILAGQGIRLSDSTGLFREFVERMDIPVVNSRMGIDSILTDSKYFAGRCGNHGYRSSHFAIQTCDILLILGSHLAPNTTGYNVPEFSKQSYKILIECDPTEFNKYQLKIDDPVEGDLNDFLHKALECAYKKGLKGSHEKWVACCQDWLKRYPVLQKRYIDTDVLNSYMLVNEVTKQAKEHDIVLADTGSSCSVVAQAWDVKEGQKVFISGGLSAMGYWATSMGLAEANRDGKGKGQVLVFVGDGALQMNIHEYATIAVNQIPVKIFLVSNDGYQFVRMSQSSYNINPTFGTDASVRVPIPNNENIARAYGLNYLSCRDVKDLPGVVGEALAAEGPVVCEVFVSKDLEIEPRIRSYAKGDGTFIMPTYENLYPYLDEEVLKEELNKAYE